MLSGLTDYEKMARLNGSCIENADWVLEHLVSKTIETYGFYKSTEQDSLSIYTLFTNTKELRINPYLMEAAEAINNLVSYGDQCVPLGEEECEELTITEGWLDFSFDFNDEGVSLKFNSVDGVLYELHGINVRERSICVLDTDYMGTDDEDVYIYFKLDVFNFVLLLIGASYCTNVFEILRSHNYFDEIPTISYNTQATRDESNRLYDLERISITE